MQTALFFCDVTRVADLVSLHFSVYSVSSVRPLLPIHVFSFLTLVHRYAPRYMIISHIFLVDELELVQHSPYVLKALSWTWWNCKDVNNNYAYT